MQNFIWLIIPSNVLHSSSRDAIPLWGTISISFRRSYRSAIHRGFVPRQANESRLGMEMHWEYQGFRLVQLQWSRMRVLVRYGNPECAQEYHSHRHWHSTVSSLGNWEIGMEASHEKVR